MPCAALIAALCPRWAQTPTLGKQGWRGYLIEISQHRELEEGWCNGYENIHGILEGDVLFRFHVDPVRLSLPGCDRLAAAMDGRLQKFRGDIQGDHEAGQDGQAGSRNGTADAG